MNAPQSLLAGRALFPDCPRPSLITASFAVSAALHLAVLFGVRLHEDRLVEVPPQPLSVVLAPAAEIAVPAPRHVPPSPRAVQPVLKPPPAPRPEPKPAPQPEPKPVAPIQSESLPPSVPVAELTPPPAPALQSAAAPSVLAAAERIVEPEYRAAYLQNPPPRYPLSARRNGEQGTVYLRVLVTVEGRAAQVAVERSSGFRVLDRAALEAVRDYRFAPARRGNKAIEKWAVVPIVYKLEDE